MKTPYQSLEIIATALYGYGWGTHLSVDCGVNQKTIYRWKLGQSPLRMDNPIFGKLHNLLRRRSRELHKLSIVTEAIVARHGTRHGRAKTIVLADQQEAAK